MGIFSDAGISPVAFTISFSENSDFCCGDDMFAVEVF